MAKGNGMLKLLKPCEGTITSKFGFRTKPKAGWHSGLDIANKLGTSILSCYKGSVVFAGLRGGYGQCVIIKHDTLGNVWTLYGHLNSIDCNVGDKVMQQQRIGTMGSTGYSTGPHVHLECRIGFNGILACRNPVQYLEGLEWLRS